MLISCHHPWCLFSKSHISLQTVIQATSSCHLVKLISLKSVCQLKLLLDWKSQIGTWWKATISGTPNRRSRRLINPSMLIFFSVLGRKMREASLISRGNRSRGLSSARKMDLGCEKPRLPRAALDSAIWRCLFQKPVKFNSTGAQLGNRFPPS